jgi:hypothetical protein
MRQCLLSFLILVAMASGSGASCVDRSAFVRSTVSITREFGEDERRAEPGVLGIRGTGWFLSPRLVVTAAHVVEAMHLSAADWREIEVRETDGKASVPARIHHLAGTHAEKIAVIELQAPFRNAVPLRGQAGASGS